MMVPTPRRAQRTMTTLADFEEIPLSSRAVHVSILHFVLAELRIVLAVPESLLTVGTHEHVRRPESPPCRTGSPGGSEARPAHPKGGFRRGRDAQGTHGGELHAVAGCELAACGTDPN